MKNRQRMAMLFYLAAFLVFILFIAVNFYCGVKLGGGSPEINKILLLPVVFVIVAFVLERGWKL